MPVVLLGCAPEPPPIEYETENLRIGSELDAPFCNGDLVQLEQTIEIVERDLDLDMGKPVTVYVWSEGAWWAGAYQHCSVHASGCYNSFDHTIHTIYNSLRHELVHAVSRGNDSGYFFDEGIANLYGGDQAEFGSSAPSENIDLSRDAIDQKAADHFVRWVRDRWGAEKLGDFVRTSGNGSKAFERAYGMTVEEAEELYFEEAPYHYTSIYTCEGAPLMSVSAGERHWREDISLDCPDGDDTRSSGIGMIVHRTFDIPEPGYYTVNHDGYWFDIYRCSPERVEDAFAPDAEFWDDVPPEHSGFPSPNYRHYEGQPSWSLYMKEGKHDIGVGLLGHETGVVSLEIYPTLGPQPPAPD